MNATEIPSSKDTCKLLFLSIRIYTRRSCQSRCWNRLKDFGRERPFSGPFRPTLWDAIIKDPTERTRGSIVRLSRCYPVNAQCIIWIADKGRDFSSLAWKFLRFPSSLYNWEKWYRCLTVKIRCCVEIDVCIKGRMALDGFVQIYPEDRGWRKIVDKCFLHGFKKLNVYCGFFCQTVCCPCGVLCKQNGRWNSFNVCEKIVWNNVRRVKFCATWGTY